MTDLALCSNPANCPRKAECYRATATPSEHWQSYAAFWMGEECGFFVPIVGNVAAISGRE